ncbi:bacillithiol biosynthesis deacetylase BshB1 [Flavobacteriales bacterium]|mgnify:FL=1|jgi:bacillithiol biosynthesis deacetylase BshB1|nr:bacillithiol biosynthesis deacetylase BshB1 [Flavobacteriales bacterium]|tara:strand:+ start:21 stop:722 length:702 start_codon:yes stop_codon:yes gene_type:complete
MKLDILVFAAHPDDAELGCGGTIIKHTSNGFSVGVIDLTKGELGTRGSDKIRLEEAEAASKIMNLTLRENLSFDDGFFVNDDLHKKVIIKKIRKYRPDIILTNAPSDRHPDHARASQLTIDSCFLSGLEKIDTNQKVWRPKAIYHYIQFNNLNPDFVVDITKQFDQKIDAVKSYKSQFFDPKSKENNTIISTKDFFDSIEYRAKDLGRQTSCNFAEGFISHQLPKLDFLNNFK